MKFFHITILLLIIWMGVANAQLTFGPVLGINFSGTTGGWNFTNYDRDYGWKAGGMVYIPLGKRYFLDPGLNINTKSYKYNFADAYPVNNVVVPSYFYEHLVFDYIEVPVSLQRKFSCGFHLGAGAFAGYQLSQERNETVDYVVEINSIITHVAVTSSSNDMTAERFQFGVQPEIGYVKSGFDLALTLQYHLTPLYNSLTDEPRELHFFILNLGLAYHFNLKGKAVPS